MSESENKEAKDLGLQFTCGMQWDYFEVSGAAMWWNEAKHDTEYLGGDHAYRSLVVRATASRGMSDQSYGWRFQFKDMGSIDLNEAERLVKSLRQIDRGVDRTRKQLGGAATFGAWMLRVAKAMGVKKFVFPSEYQDHNVRTVEPESAAQIVDSWFSDYHQGKEVKVA